jgi:hypothetical protein
MTIIELQNTDIKRGRWISWNIILFTTTWIDIIEKWYIHNDEIVNHIYNDKVGN